MTDNENSRRRGKRWVRLGTGVHVPASVADGERLWAELRAWQSVLPSSAVFTGLTAAQAWGLWLPPLPPDTPRFVAIPMSSGRIRRPQLRVTRHPDTPAHDEVDGVRLAPVPEVLLACARSLCLLDLVVLIDAALQLELCGLADLQQLARSGRPGSRRLREALPWADGRSESAFETLLRMLHRACGVRVEPQVVLRADDGSFIAKADLLIVGTTTLQEYDGADHREQKRYRKDRRRDSRLAGGGYTRHGWVSEDVLTKSVAILREADAAIGRPHDPSRIRAWHALLRESLFSPAGTALTRRAWGLTDLADPAA